MRLSDIATVPLRARAVRAPTLRLLLLKERMQSGIAVDPFARAFRDNPYPALHEVRERDPTHWLETGQAWLFTRHDDVSALLRDRRCSNDRTPSAYSVDAAWRRDSRFQRVMEHSVLGLDAPDHTRLRSLVGKAFTPRVVAQMQSRIVELTDELLDRVTAQGEFEVMRDLAQPLPVQVIAELLGAPAEDHERFGRWAAALGDALDLTFDRRTLERADQAVAEMRAYFRPLIEERRDSRDDLLSALAAAEEQGDQLSEEELYAFCVLLLAAGSQTTTHAIGNSLLALLQDREALNGFRDRGESVESAIEELLRYDSPVQFTSRRALESMELNGKRIRPGDLLVLSLGAANRDPEQFANPDRLDLARTDNRHVAFGLGSHYCMGAPLARLELSVALPRVLERFPSIQLDAGVRHAWLDTLVLRGLKTLPVRPLNGSA